MGIGGDHQPPVGPGGLNQIYQGSIIPRGQDFIAQAALKNFADQAAGHAAPAAMTNDDMVEAVERKWALRAFQRRRCGGCHGFTL
jgi:hypothetical protein